MSYDLDVFARERLGRGAIVELLTSMGLIPGTDTAEDGSVVAMRGARQRYSFTVEPAAAIEPEDVPDEVTAVMLEPRWLYQVLVEGSFETEIPHAVRFARKLAQASSGVVVDQQGGTLWSRGKLRTPPRVERGLIDVVELSWWVMNRTDPEEAAALWVDLARRHLPEALPRRWGVYEPLSEKADPDNPAAFADFVARREDTVYFKASAPAIEGSIPVFRWNARFGDVNLSVHRDALQDEAWRVPLQRLFIEFARGTGAIVATAEVVRDYEWSGRSLWSGDENEDAASLASKSRWLGLPPYPVWWIWFGPDYAPLVHDHLDSTQVRVVGDGLFHARSVEPADRDQLIAQVPTSKPSDGKDRPPRAIPTVPWLPTELLAVPKKYRRNTISYPNVKRGTYIPEPLR